MPRPDAIARKGFEEVDERTLERGVGLDEHSEAGGARRLDVEAVAPDDTTADCLEHLSRFRRRESLEIRF